MMFGRMDKQTRKQISTRTSTNTGIINNNVLLEYLLKFILTKIDKGNSIN